MTQEQSPVAPAWRAGVAAVATVLAVAPAAAQVGFSPEHTRPSKLSAGDRDLLRQTLSGLLDEAEVGEARRLGETPTPATRRDGAADPPRDDPGGGLRSGGHLAAEGRTERAASTCLFCQRPGRHLGHRRMTAGRAATAPGRRRGAGLARRRGQSAPVGSPALGQAPPGPSAGSSGRVNIEPSQGRGAMAKIGRHSPTSSAQTRRAPPPPCPDTQMPARGSAGQPGAAQMSVYAGQVEPLAKSISPAVSKVWPSREMRLMFPGTEEWLLGPREVQPDRPRFPARARPYLRAKPEVR